MVSIKEWVVAAVVLAAGVGAHAAEMKLTVDWNGVAMREAFPVTGGVPLARGALKDAKAVAMRIGGTVVPLQARPLATWPDGSVKWLLLDFHARPDTAEITLVYGDNVPAAVSAPVPVRAQATKEAVTVDTGLVKFTVRADGAGFIDELSYKGKPLFTHEPGRRLNVMDALHTSSPADYHPMDRNLRGAIADPSAVQVKSVTLETEGPLHTVVLIDGVYKYKQMGQTITGTEIKGDCPFRVRIHAYAGHAMLRVEHFFYYEGDGDHDFVSTLSLRTPLPEGAGTVRFVGEQGATTVSGPMAGLFQQNADSYQVWNSTGDSARVTGTGARFNGVLDVRAGDVALAVGVKDFWQNAAKSLHADLTGRQVRINLWAPEAPPLDFRRHAREWSVGEAGTPNDPNGVHPQPFKEDRPNYRLASKGVGKTHYVLLFPHAPDLPEAELIATYRLFNQRPLLWAAPSEYASSLALGRYREFVPGEHVEMEKALASPFELWRFSQERFRWYGFWLYGNVQQSFNLYEQNGRWSNDFGRWGWANGDSVGRLGYALMLQAVRKCRRDEFEFAEKYLYNVHDVCSTHTPAYPRHFEGSFGYVKGAAHRHGAWPWADTYVGSRGAHPVGAKIYYYLTGEGHARDILEEITELALKNPSGGEGDGPLGGNAQIFLYQWEATGDDAWRQRVKTELDQSDLLRKADSGWLIMLSSAFGIYNALEEYADLTGDTSQNDLAASFADRAMPEKMKGHWTWGGYYRVYSYALNATGDKKYLDAINEMLPLYTNKMRESLAGRYAPDEWPGPPGGPTVLIDANIIRDIPFALYSLEQAKQNGKSAAAEPNTKGGK